MRFMIPVIAATALTAAAAFAQLRITSLEANGSLAWTNYISKGLYEVQSANSPTGTWTILTNIIDTDSAITNKIIASIPTNNPKAFFRVGWVIPDPIGDWDYRGYDTNGTLVITGQLQFLSMTLTTAAYPNPSYRLAGAWAFQYAGPPTNATWWLGPQIGSGYFDGTIGMGASHLYVHWPTNVVDANIDLFGDMWGNTCTGSWAYIAFAPRYIGPFTAVKKALTNLIDGVNSNSTLPSVHRQTPPAPAL